MYILLKKVVSPSGEETYVQAVDWMGRAPKWHLPYRELLKVAGIDFPKLLNIDTLVAMRAANMLDVSKVSSAIPMHKCIDWTLTKNQIPVLTPGDLERIGYALRRATPIKAERIGNRTETSYFLTYDYIRAEDASREMYVIGEKELDEYLAGTDDLGVRGERRLAEIDLKMNPYRLGQGVMA